MSKKLFEMTDEERMQDQMWNGDEREAQIQAELDVLFQSRSDVNALMKALRGLLYGPQEPDQAYARQVLREMEDKYGDA